MSKSNGKAANYVPTYLIQNGYNVIPVNPKHHDILGRKTYPLTSSVGQEVDIVNVFRPSDDVPAVVTDALKKDGIKLIWMQEGIYNKEAEQMALQRGVEVVFNRCMMVEHMRLFAGSG